MEVSHPYLQVGLRFEAWLVGDEELALRVLDGDGATVGPVRRSSVGELRALMRLANHAVGRFGEHPAVRRLDQFEVTVGPGGRKFFVSRSDVASAVVKLSPALAGM
jgi:hypothetical protein